MTGGRLKDRIALVTGAASGIGRATAQLFAEEGARVVVVDLDASQASDTARGISQAGHTAIFARADVADADEVEHVVGLAIDTYGRLDIVHNNAGVFASGFLEDMSEASWDRLFAVNLKSIVLAVKYAIPQMKRQGEAASSIPHPFPHSWGSTGVRHMSHPRAASRC